jgi:hypothetical protein
MGTALTGDLAMGFATNQAQQANHMSPQEYARRVGGFDQPIGQLEGDQAQRAQKLVREYHQLTPEKRQQVIQRAASPEAAERAGNAVGEAEKNNPGTADQIDETADRASQGDPGALGQLGDMADTVLGGIGLDTQNMSDLQKIVMLVSGVTALGGGLGGSNTAMGLGGLGLVASLLMGKDGPLSNLMGGGESPAVPDDYQQAQGDARMSLEQARQQLQEGEGKITNEQIYDTVAKMGYPPEAAQELIDKLNTATGDGLMGAIGSMTGQTYDTRRQALQDRWDDVQQAVQKYQKGQN